MMKPRPKERLTCILDLARTGLKTVRAFSFSQEEMMSDSKKSVTVRARVRPALVEAMRAKAETMALCESEIIRLALSEFCIGPLKAEGPKRRAKR
jgi:hypothetical protein